MVNLLIHSNKYDLHENAGRVATADADNQRATATAVPQRAA